MQQLELKSVICYAVEVWRERQTKRDSGRREWDWLGEKETQEWLVRKADTVVPYETIS
jgi:hypothetical protein